MKRKPDHEKVERLAISLPPDLASWVRRAAAKRRVPVSFLVRGALEPGFLGRRAK